MCTNIERKECPFSFGFSMIIVSESKIVVTMMVHTIVTLKKFENNLENYLQQCSHLVKSHDSLQQFY